MEYLQLLIKDKFCALQCTPMLKKHCILKNGCIHKQVKSRAYPSDPTIHCKVIVISERSGIYTHAWCFTNPLTTGPYQSKYQDWEEVCESCVYTKLNITSILYFLTKLYVSSVSSVGQYTSIFVCTY